jgi:hypothetical protein
MPSRGRQLATPERAFLVEHLDFRDERAVSSLQIDSYRQRGFSIRKDATSQPALDGTAQSFRIDATASFVCARELETHLRAVGRSSVRLL